VSIYLTGTERGLYQQIASLKGEKDQGNNANPGYTSYFIVGPQDSTILSADAFYYRFCPEGLHDKKGKPSIYVTYNINRLNLADGATDSTNKGFRTELRNHGVYNPSAGYEVYHLTVA
jgi:hypothetical protein